MKSVLIVLTIALSTLATSAQSPAKLLKQAEKAMGGAKALRSVSGWEKEGTVVRMSDEVKGRVVLRTATPNLYAISLAADAFELETGYNGKSAWRLDSKDGLRTLTGDAGIGAHAEAAFRNSYWLDAKKEKFKIVSGGKGRVGMQPADVVHLHTTKGAKISLFFDSVTKLILREEFSGGSYGRAYEYSDYRPVAGIQVPHRITIDINGHGPAFTQDIFEVVLEKVRPGVQISRSGFDFPKLTNEPLPDIPSLLKELQANEEKVEGLLDTYSFVQRSTRRELGKDGVLRDKESQTFQLSFYKGRRIRRLIEKDGKPLTAEQQTDEDKEAANRVEEIEKDIAKAEAKGGPPSSEESRRVSIAEVLRASTLSNPRRERLRGRDVIVFDFEPNPAFDYKNAKSMLKFFGKTAGAMWIDEKDKQVARLEAFLADSFNVGGGLVAKLKKGATFTLEQERVNDEIWLPSVTDINLSVRVFLVKGIDLNQVIRSYDYRKFATEVKDAKVNPVNQ
ncbi:MAG TPA: hypothetical protein VNA22_04235 [Pyrinomonadaceae bacterium]|nr:hypothetical protein [Pyrinomonadaceae bacterium]